MTTGHIYQSANMTDLLSDPYVSGNIDLGSLFTSSNSLSLQGNYNSSTYSISPANIQTAKVHLNENGIQLQDGTDIKMGDRSLKEFMDKIEQRLAILSPNTKLEKDWAELKELGNRYRKLEKDIQSKMKTWDILSKNDDTDAQI